MQNTLNQLNKTGSYLIISSNQNANLLKELGFTENNPDVMLVDLQDGKKSIGIAQTREVVKFLSQKPLAKKEKVVAIQNAGTMTDEAQNALLKILEEPPIYAKIILLTDTSNEILDTVKSRCIQIRLSKNQTSTETKHAASDYPTWQQIGQMGIAARFKLAEEISKEERLDILSILEEWIKQERLNLLANNVNSIQNIESLQKIIGDLKKTNVGARIALETLFINLI